MGATLVPLKPACDTDGHNRIGFISDMRYSGAMSATSQSLGIMIREARTSRGWSQQRLADAVGTAQSAVHRIENGQQNLSLNMIGRLAEALDMPLIQTATAGQMNFEIEGPTQLSGEI